MHKLEQLLNRTIEFGLFTHEEEEIIKQELLHIETRLTPKTAYIQFIEQFNTITKKKYKPDIESRRLFYDNAMIHSLSDRIEALKNAVSDPWVQESNTILSPKWILKPDNVAKYLNYTPAKKDTEKSNQDLSDTDYGKIAVQ